MSDRKQSLSRAQKTIVLQGTEGLCASVIGSTVLENGDRLILIGAPGKTTENLYDALADKYSLGENDQLLEIYPFDPANADSSNCAQLANDLSSHCQRIDVVIHNNNALCPPQGLDELSAADWYRGFQINLHAPWLIQQALLRLQLGQINPRIIFVVDQTSDAFLGAWGLSKLAQRHMMHAWAREIKPGRDGRGPVVAGIDLTGLDDDARRYYFPGQPPGHSGSLNLIPLGLNQLLAGEAQKIHQSIWSCLDQRLIQMRDQRW